jgi:hypothetical protein
MLHLYSAAAVLKHDLIHPPGLSPLPPLIRQPLRLSAAAVWWMPSSPVLQQRMPGIRYVENTVEHKIDVLNMAAIKRVPLQSLLLC